MITIEELLEDPVYKKFFTTAPRMMNGGRFRVMVLDRKGNRWRKKDFDTYAEAFQVFKKFLKAGRIKDGAIISLGQSFGPPTRWVKIKGKFIVRDGKKLQVTKKVPWVPKVDPMDETHQWCVWCRRPSIFRYYRKHHALKGLAIDSSVRRCSMCGASERIQNHG